MRKCQTKVCQATKTKHKLKGELGRRNHLMANGLKEEGLLRLFLLLKNFHPEISENAFNIEETSTLPMCDSAVWEILNESLVRLLYKIISQNVKQSMSKIQPSWPTAVTNYLLLYIQGVWSISLDLTWRNG